MKVKEAIEVIEKDGWFMVRTKRSPQGATIKETLSRMRTAIKFHLEGLKKEGCDIQKPSTKVKYLEIFI